jgi:hypothetical protein
VCLFPLLFVLIVFLKLHGMLSSAPLRLPGRDFWNILMAFGNIARLREKLSVVFCTDWRNSFGVFLQTSDPVLGLTMIGATTAISRFFFFFKKKRKRKIV